MVADVNFADPLDGRHLVLDWCKVRLGKSPQAFAEKFRGLDGSSAAELIKAHWRDILGEDVDGQSVTIGDRVDVFLRLLTQRYESSMVS